MRSSTAFRPGAAGVRNNTVACTSRGARHLLDAFRPRRTVYTGSTSVYAQTDGAWVDESSPAEPDRETGHILRETEAIVLAAHGGTVARLAGIYGPGRSVLLRKFLASEAVIEGDGLRWLNQIQRDDGRRRVVPSRATGRAARRLQRGRRHPPSPNAASIKLSPITFTYPCRPPAPSTSTANAAGPASA